MTEEETATVQYYEVSEREDGTWVVRFDRRHWSKKRAWQFLIANPSFKLEGYLQRLRDLFGEQVHSLANPWRSAHGQGFWSWTMRCLTEEQLQALVEDVESQEIREFDPEVWCSTSNKYRHVARVPEGMTAIEALKAHAPDAYQRFMVRMESTAQMEWMRGQAQKIEGCHVELTEPEWLRFRKAGGHSV